MATVYYAAATLDGFIARPDGSLDWLMGFEGPEPGLSRAEATENAYENFYEKVGAVVMGSATYEWLQDGGHEWAYSDVPGWVFSSRELKRFEGADIRFVAGEVSEHHPEIAKAASGRDVWVVGGGDLASQFAEAGLLDELIVTQVPVWIGEGIPLFARPVEGELRLLESRTFRSGMTELRFVVP